MILTFIEIKTIEILKTSQHAELAQLVEQCIRNAEVEGSSPLFGTISYLSQFLN